jgi:spore coat protein A
LDAAGVPLPGTNVIGPGPTIWQIGCEGGYLAGPVGHNNMMPADTVNFTGNLFVICAERPDIVIDFSGMAGKEYILYNDLSGPYPGGDPINDHYAGNPASPAAVGTSPDTRNILKIVVGAAITTPTPAADPVAIAAALEAVPRLDVEAFLAAPVTYANQPAYLAAGKPPLTLNPGVVVNKVRNLTLNENFDEWGRLRQLVGTTTVRPGGTGFGRLYLDPTTEISTQGQIEVWNIFNLTADSHPMHFHAVNVQILKRQPFRVVAGRFLASGVAHGPELDEMGYKETCKMNPGEVITVVFKVQLPVVPFTVPASNRTGNNEFVWHCHILEHEEHDMMRPFVIV